MRVDRLISLKYGISRHYAQQIIRENRVVLDGRPVKKNRDVKEEAPLVINWPAAAKTELEPEPIPLNILYQDRDLAVIEKPAGLLTHPFGKVRSGTLVNALLYHIRDLSLIRGVQKPGIVHRLDRQTSGLMVVAKNDHSHRFLSEEFRLRRVQKEYVAMVKGVIPWKEQNIVLPLRHDRKNHCRMGVGYLKGKESVTRIRVDQTFREASLVTIFPRTGRTHQIRVVLHFLGYPIIGDTSYGNQDPQDKLINRQALHAGGLSFRHPRTEKTLSFTLALPPDMERLKKDLTAG